MIQESIDFHEQVGTAWLLIALGVGWGGCLLGGASGACSGCPSAPTQPSCSV